MCTRTLGSAFKWTWWTYSFAFIIRYDFVSSEKVCAVVNRNSVLIIKMYTGYFSLRCVTRLTAVYGMVSNICMYVCAIRYDCRDGASLLVYKRYRIWSRPGSRLPWDILQLLRETNRDWGFMCYPQLLHINAAIVSTNMPRFLPFIYLNINHSHSSSPSMLYNLCR
jgi:hypothetical protein